MTSGKIGLYVTAPLPFVILLKSCQILSQKYLSPFPLFITECSATMSHYNVPIQCFRKTVIEPTCNHPNPAVFQIFAEGEFQDKKFGVRRKFGLRYV